jgi:hypothetical protein
MPSVLRREPHQVANNSAPELFGSARGIKWLGSLALPAETITVASAAAGVFFFLWLSLSEATRFFFRLSFSPVWFAAFATLLALLIAWRGSRRPGPVVPRVWVLLLLLLNFAVLVVSIGVRYFPLKFPLWLQEPWPLDPLAVSGAVATLVLSPRLYPMHPLKALVQTIAPLSLGIVLAITVPLAVAFINTQIEIERRILVEMADKINAAAKRLLTAALFRYSDPAIVSSYPRSLSRIDAVLAGLLDSPQSVALPDGRRWEAARILENERLLFVGELETAVRNLVDAQHALLMSEEVPEVRTGRYVVVDGRYVLNDQYFARQRMRPRFAPGAEIGTTYYSNVAKWLAHTQVLRNGQAGSYYVERVEKTLEARCEEFSGRVGRKWWAQLLNTRSNPEAPPQLELGDAFETPLYNGIAPMAQFNHWNSMTWGGFLNTNLTRDGPCRVVSAKSENPRPIAAPPESLTEEQRADGLSYSRGIMFDASAVAQCFAYHAPVDSSRTPVVAELRFTWSVKDREYRFATPCSEPCPPVNPRVPGDAPITGMDVLVDVPDSNPSGFPAQVTSAFSESAERQSGGALPEHLQPQEISQSDLQKVIYIKIR